MKILFVDDEPDARTLFSQVFRVHGHSAHLATNGLEAIAAVRAELFDAIVIDGQMPLMNGWDAVCEIRGLANGHHLPIILFSAFSSDDSQQRALEAGADLFLDKPILPHTVITQIERLVRAKTQE